MNVKLLRENVQSWNEYPFNLPVVRNLETLLLHRNVTFIVGENGTGKSTLLEAVAMGINVYYGLVSEAQRQKDFSHETYIL